VFGTSRKDVEKTSPIQGRLVANPLWHLNKDQVQLLFSDQNQLVAVGKDYRSNNELYMGQLRDLFGPAAKNNIETFQSVRDLPFDQTAPFEIDIAERTDEGVITYHFANSLAVVRPVYLTRVGSRGSVRKYEHVQVDVHDAHWVREQLERDLELKFKAIAWAKRVVDAASGDSLNSDALPDLADSVREARPTFFTEGVHYFAKADADKRPKQATAGNAKDKKDAFCVVERYTRDFSFPPKIMPKGAVAVTIRLDCLPGRAESPLLSTNLAAAVVRANSIVSQAYFMPRGDTITVVMPKVGILKSYEWTTHDRLKVTVTDDSLTIIKYPSSL
jgi:hypothetical protein